MNDLQREERVQRAIVWIVILSILAVSFFSCLTPQKAVGYLKKKHLLADTCAANFPVKDSLITRDSISYDTLIVGEPFYIFDTVEVGGVPIIIKEKCPPSQIITRTVYKDTTVWKKDMAQITALEGVVKKLQSQVDKKTGENTVMKEKVKGKNKIILWLVIALIVLMIWILRKPVMSIIKTWLLPVPHL